MSARLTRIPELEGIRGVLSLLVVSGHVYSDPIFWFPGCMEFFFVISGFLITRILLNQEHPTAAFIRNYAVRRILRIWPMYYVALILYFVVSGFLIASAGFSWHGIEVAWDPSWPPFLMSAFFVQNVDVLVTASPLTYPPLFGHSWSVAIEEQYYFLWPLVIWGIARGSRGFRIALAALAIGGAVAMRASAYIEYGTSIGLWLLPCRLDSFCGGICLAFLFRGQGTAAAASARPYALMAVVGGLVLLPYLAIGYGSSLFTLDARLAWTVFDPTLGFSILGFATIGVVIVKSGSRAMAWLRGPWLSHLGAISYSTYLLHPIVIVGVTLALKAFGIEHVGIQWLASLLVALGASHLTYTYIEARAMSYKDRFQYGRPGAGGAAPRTLESTVAGAAGAAAARPIGS